MQSTPRSLLLIIGTRIKDHSFPNFRRQGEFHERVYRTSVVGKSRLYLPDFPRDVFTSWSIHSAKKESYSLATSFPS